MVFNGARSARSERPLRKTVIWVTTEEPQEASGETMYPPAPAVVLRSQYNRLRLLLAIAIVAAFGLTYAVLGLATEETTTVVARQSPAADHFDWNRFLAASVAGAEAGARLDHSGRK
jgi:hypothetical protein